MNKRNYELTLNVTTGKIKIPSISIYNTDKGIFNIKLFLEKGEGKNIVKLTHDEMVNYKALFQAVKSKTKNYVELEGTLDETENFFYYDLGSKFNDQVGVYNCQIFITDTKGTNDSTADDEVVTSVPFNYTVTASILTGLNAEITANPDLPVLQELINECKILMNLDSADMSVLDPFQKKEDDAIDGTDKNIISNINSINSQIKEKANDNDVRKINQEITMSDLSNSVKEAISGGSVAVVGKNSVGIENLKNNSLSIEKTDFLMPSANLFNKNNVTINYRVDNATGNLIEADGFCASEYIEVEPSTQYSRTGNYHMAFYDGDMNYISGLGYGSPVTFTTPSNCRFIRVSIFSNTPLNSYAINKGSTLMVYEDYKCKFKIPLDLSSNKFNAENMLFYIKTENIFDKLKVTVGYSISSTTGELVNQNDDNFGASDYMEVLPSTTYCKSGNYHIAFYDTNKSFISGQQSGRTFNTPSNCKYIRITIVYNQDNIDSYMIIKGDTLPLNFIPPYKFTYENTDMVVSANKFVSYGDSITQMNQWQDGVAKGLGLTSHVRGIGGTTIAETGTIAWVKEDGTYVDRPNGSNTQPPDTIEILSSMSNDERINTIPTWQTDVITLMGEQMTFI